MKIDPYKKFSSRSYVIEKNDHDFVPPEDLSLITEDSGVDLSTFDWGNYKLCTDNVVDIKDYIYEYYLTDCMTEIKELFSTSQVRFSIFEGKILLALPVKFDPFTLKKTIGKQYNKVDKEYGIFCRIFDEINALVRLGDDEYGYELYRNVCNVDGDGVKKYCGQQNKREEVKINYPADFRDTKSFLKIKSNTEEEGIKPINNLSSVSSVSSDFSYKLQLVAIILVGSLFWVFVRYTDFYKDLMNLIYPYLIYISVTICVLSYIWGVNLFTRKERSTFQDK